MARMSEEHETVNSIWHQVNRYIQTKLAHAHPSTEKPASSTDPQPPHITLGSWDNYRDVQGYEKEVMEGFGFADFAEKLVVFLQTSVNVVVA